jgi:hypothetical protein
MKKADKPRSNATQGAAERLSRGAEHNNDDLWKDEPDPSPAKPAEPSTQTPLVLRQRRRPRGRKA